MLAAALAGCPQEPRSDRAVQMYARLVRAGDPEARRTAAGNLARFRGQEIVAVPALLDALEDSDESVKEMASISLQVLLNRSDLPSQRAAWEKVWRDLKPGFERMASRTPEEAARMERASIHNEEGASFLKAGQWRLAEDAFLKAVTVDKESPVHWNNLGRARALQGRWPDAVDCYRKAVELDPRFVMAHYNLGEAYLAVTDLTGRDHTDEALQHAMAASKLDASERAKTWEAHELHARILLRKARLALDSRDRAEMYSRAEAAIERAMAHSPEVPEIRKTAALIAYGRGLYYKALQEVRIVHRLGWHMDGAFLDRLEEKLGQEAAALGHAAPEVPRPEGARGGTPAPPPSLRPPDVR
jgi:Tfp pilus assembly protein PilF